MANYYKHYRVAAVEAYDGTAANAATLVGTYGYITVQKAETGGLGNGILAVVDNNGNVQNAYKDTYIAVIDSKESQDAAERQTIEVWDKTAFEKYFIISGT